MFVPGLFEGSVLVDKRDLDYLLFRIVGVICAFPDEMLMVLDRCRHTTFVYCII